MQFEGMDQRERGALFQYFTTNLPSTPGDRALEDFLKELPIFLNWTGERAQGKDVLGLCSASLMTAIACPPSQLPPSLQVRYPITSNLK